MNQNLPVQAQSSGMPVQALPDTNVSVQVTTAKQYPRDIEVATKNSVTLATCTKETARSCLYCRPVGRDNTTNKMKFAEGPSIRLAEIIRSEWGNLKVGTMILPEEEGFARVRWVAYDLEKNVENTGEVTKSIIKSNGKRYGDNQIQVIMLALQGIASRNAIMSIVPRAFADQIITEIKTKMVGSKDALPKTFEVIAQSYERIGVNKEQLLECIEAEDETKIDKDGCVKLLNLMNIIKDGICSIVDIFPDVVSGKAAPKSRKPEPKTTAKPKVAPEEVPAAQEEGNSEDEYTKLINDFQEMLGLTEEQVNDQTMAEFSIPDWKMVPQDMQPMVIDHFKGQL